MEVKISDLEGNTVRVVPVECDNWSEVRESLAGFDPEFRCEVNLGKWELFSGTVEEARSKSDDEWEALMEILDDVLSMM